MEQMAINRSHEASLIVRSEITDVRYASEWLISSCNSFDVPQPQSSRLEICLNEVLANIMSHGAASGSAQPIELHLHASHQSGQAMATLTISDSGLAFNPLSSTPKSLPTNLSEAEPGGLGLHMLKSFSDALDYSYSNHQNHLSITVQWV